MGYLLYRELRDRAPADWTPTERLVAWVIADDANDLTRRSWIKLPEIMTRTGIGTESGVRQALQRLAARGYEFRVPIKTGKDGRLVFAAKGHSLDYLVPPLPQRRLQAGAFETEGAGETSRDCREDLRSDDPKATVTDAKGDCAQSPLSSTPLLKDQNQAPRRARQTSFAGETDIPSMLDEVRQAAVSAFGDTARNLTDEQCSAMYNRFCRRPDGSPREIDGSVRRYLLGKPFKDIPDLETALKPKRRRDSIPCDLQVRYDDVWTSDDERRQIVEQIIGRFGPAEEPAAVAMINRRESLAYIIAAVESGNLFTAA